MRKLIVGNWKMNGTRDDLEEISQIAHICENYNNVDSGLCLPATLIAIASSSIPYFCFGGQDCHANASGAHTGCISAPMLLDAGARIVIVGHSERRADQGETDADICGKARAAMMNGLKAIICVGETEAQRDAGEAEQVVIGQVAASLPENATAADICVAYEPVWAIGTGRIPSVADVADMHGAIRRQLVDRFGAQGQEIAILYGGSMNGDNAADLLAIPDVDGGLIGGASLTAAKFEPILMAASKASKEV